MQELFGGFISTPLAVSGWCGAAEESRELSLRYREGTWLVWEALPYIRNMLTLLNMENQGNTNGPFFKYLKVHLGSHRDIE